MRSPAFGGHPSDTHVLWEDGGGNGGKRFDEDRLQAWCQRHGLEYETDQRVDHDRGEDLREQYRIVFAWSSGESESFDVDGEEWDITTQETPETFLEIDSEGMARVSARGTEQILDLQELWTDGPALCFRSASMDDTKRLPIDRLR